ncbi:MAG: 2-oxo acid dehydrogenase subunit E2 [Phycisphaerales bacterium]|nr:MAG: 2-oxo acid dehydrogenase subunit E2 [Phycisphaerales bacterium]
MAHHKSSDPNIFILPDLGEGVHEAELISWKVKPGETVEEHQTVAEMETDKALVEVPSPRAGVIKELRGEPGQIMKVGEVAWTYEGAADSAPASKTAPAKATPVKQAPAPAKAAPAAKASNDEEEREDAGTVVGTMGGSLGAITAGDKALATPAVRRLARDLGVDIDSVPGSGIAGRVTEKDVRAAAASDGGASREPEPAPARRVEEPERRSVVTTARQDDRSRNSDNGGASSLATSVPARTPTRVPAPNELTRIPFRGVRRTIANRLRHSMDTAVHFTVMDEADVSALDKVRKTTAASSGEKVSFLPFVIGAVCRALRAFPALNSTVDDDNEEILRHRSIHIGMAADTDHGLTVPVIFDADTMGVLQIARQVDELARMTRDRSIPRDLLMGSTFTVTNVGSYAGRFATPVINYPEVAILGVGRARDGVSVRDGAIRIAKLMPLSLAADHRTVDGAEAAKFLQHVIDLLEQPETLLAPARG